MTDTKALVKSAVSSTAQFNRALMHAGGTGLTPTMLDGSLIDFLTLLATNRIAVSATYCGEPSNPAITGRSL